MKISNSNDNDLQEFQFTSETRKENHIRMVDENLNEKMPKLVKETNLQHILSTQFQPAIILDKNQN